MIRLEGMESLQKQIEEMGKSLDRGTKEKALKTGGEYLKDKVKANAPVLTGNLRDSIIVSDVEQDSVSVGSEITGSDTVSQGRAYYGRFLEFGTSKMKPQPFMGPTFENNQDRVQEKMKDVIRRELGL